MLDSSTIVFSELPSVVWKDRKKLPKIQCVYFVLDGSRRLKYIGMTVDLQRRFAGHDKYQFFLRVIPYMQIAWIDTPGLSDAEMKGLEIKLIKHFQPPLNTENNPNPAPGNRWGLDFTDFDLDLLFDPCNKRGDIKLNEVQQLLDRINPNFTDDDLARAYIYAKEDDRYLLRNYNGRDGIFALVSTILLDKKAPQY